MRGAGPAATLAYLALLIHSTASTIPPAAENAVSRLGLQRNVFGSYFKALWTSPLNTTDLPPRFKGGSRPLSSSIYNLYAVDPDAGNDQGGFPLHRLQSDEAWFFYEGDGPIDLYLFDLDARKVDKVTVGTSFPWFNVPQQTWIGALLSTNTSWALTGSQNTPGFDPRDSEVVHRNSSIAKEFLRKFPGNQSLIKRLVSF